MCYRRSVAYNTYKNLSKIYILFLILLINSQLSYCWFGKHHQHHNSSIVLSTPEECARSCKDNEKPKNCYYSFTIEFYNTVGPACDVKKQLRECIYADGFERTLLPVNRQLPGPPIKVCKNDRVIVDVRNNAPGLEVTIHWHGIFQRGYQYYDGVPYVTQCPIPSSSSFRYDFVVQNSGTHFYHSHISTHMLDGQYGSLIVKDSPKNNPFEGLYEVDEHVVFLSDWTHELSMERYPGWFRHDLGQTAKNILINGLGNWTDPDTNQTTNGKLAVFKVTKGKRYRMRLINSFSTVCLAEFRIVGHNYDIIAQDGANVKPTAATKIITSAGERVDFILTANKTVDSYWIQVRGLGECKDKRVQQLAILQYEGAPSTPSAPPPTYKDVASGIEYNSLDGTKCNTNNSGTALCVNQLESLKEEPDLLKVEPDEQHVLSFWFFNYTQYENRPLFETNSYPIFLGGNDYSQYISTFNDIVFEPPASPLLTQRSSYQTICKKNQLDSCTEPCTCTQVINTKLNNVVELLIYDRAPIDDLHHPFHLHGYEFQVFSIGQFSDRRNISKEDVSEILRQHKERLERGEYRNPPGKDTVKIPLGGYAIIRFKAVNPGWWLLHCHFTWHHVTGMELVIRVGEKKDLPPIPPGFPKCDNWKPPLQTLNNFYNFKYPTKISGEIQWKRWKTFMVSYFYQKLQTRAEHFRRN